MPRARRPILPYHLRHQARGLPRSGRPSNGLILRGVVTKTIVPGSEEALSRDSARPYDVAADGGVKCDVLIIDPNYRTVLTDVPVMVGSAGLNDYEEWRPRESTASLTGEDLILSLEGTDDQITRTRDMDGDHVLVTFMGNDTNQPVIIGQIPHPNTNRKPDGSSGQQFKWRKYLRGIDIGVTIEGNVTLDLTQANDGGITTPGGAETEGASASEAGNILLTLAGGDLSTGAKLTIADGDSSAPEPGILGNTYLAAVSNLLGDETTNNNAESAMLSLLQSSLTEIAGRFAGLGVPAASTEAAAAGVGVYKAAIVLYNISIGARQGAISTSQSSGDPYLSSHLEFD